MRLSAISLCCLLSRRGTVVNADAHVKNRCPFTVYVQSVQQQESRVYSIDPGMSYSEVYKPAVSGTGVSIKIGRNVVSDVSGGHVLGPITQLEYAYTPWRSPSLWYDLSDINDEKPRQFCDHGIVLQPSSPQCPVVDCPPDCRSVCSRVYNKFDDDYATKGCLEVVDLTLTLCTR